MSRLAGFSRSTIGRKALAAVTGLILFGFLFGHVTGNLKAFLPDDPSGVPDIDVYGEFLRGMGEPALPHGAALNLMRAALILALVLHIWAVLSLARRNKAARGPVGYQRKLERVEATSSAHWMTWTGFVILAFVVMHILHMTLGTLDPASFVEGSVYGNLYRAFHQGGFVAIYLVAMAVIALHLYHGVWSLFQSLGVDNPDRNKLLRRIALGAAVFLFLAFSAVPTAFYLDVMPAPPAHEADTLEGS